MKRLSLFLLVALLIPLASEVRALVAAGSAETAGLALDVEVVGELAYVANLGFSSSGLQVFDISNRASPVELGRLPEEGGFVGARDVEVVGTLAYIADARSGNSSLRVIDVSRPRAPVEIGTLQLEGRPSDIEVVGGLAYVSVRDSGLRIIDVTDPTRPTEIGALDTPGFSDGVAVAGTLAYFADGTAFRVIDVANPSRPLEIGMLETPVFVRDVKLVGTLAYLMNDAGLQVVDVSDPTRPATIDVIETPGGVRAVEIVSGVAYVLDGVAGLRIFDVSNPREPEALGVFDTPGNSQAIAVTGHFAYIADSVGGLQVVDISNRDYPLVLGSLETPDAVGDVEVVGELAYLATSGEPPGLRVVRVSDPAMPIEVGSVAFSASGFAFAIDVEVVENYAYVTERSFVGSSLRVVDISTPSRPYEVGALDGVDGAIEVGDGLVYVADHNVGLRIIDVSQPLRPREIASLETPVRATDVEVVGDLAYVSFSLSAVAGLWVVDISDPSAPLQIGSLDLPFRVFSVEIEESFAYGAFQELQAIDVSDPTMPTEVATFEPDLTSGDLEVVRSRAFFSRGIPVLTIGGSPGTSVAVLDVSTPAQGALGGVYLPGSSVSGIDVVGGLTYVANFDGGLQIIDFGPEYLAKLRVEIDIKPHRRRDVVKLLRGKLLPVAILGSEDFDIEDVNPRTLAFGPKRARPRHRPEIRRDVNGDGWPDLISYFPTDRTGLRAGARRACINGETLDGTPFEGCDDVRIVPDSRHRLRKPFRRLGHSVPKLDRRP